MVDLITNNPKPFNPQKSLLLDRIVIRYETSSGIQRRFWRWLKRFWEWYCMGGKF